MNFMQIYVKKTIKRKFLRGFELDGAKISGFFKLQKIRTDKNFAFYCFFVLSRVCVAVITSWLLHFKTLLSTTHTLTPLTQQNKQNKGPGWGNVNTIEAAWVEQLTKKGRCYLRELAVHY